MRDIERLEREIKETYDAQFKYPYLGSSLKDCLSPLSQKELIELSRSLNLTRSSTENKPQALKRISEAYLPSVSSILYRLNRTEWDFLQALIANDGFIERDEDAWFDTYDNVLTFCSIGLCFLRLDEDRQRIVIPSEVEETIENNQELAATIERNTERTKLIFGLLDYYGVISIHDIESLLLKMVPEASFDVVSLFDDLLTLKHLFDYSFGYEMDEFILYNSDHFSDEEAVELYKKQKKKKGLGYYEINRFRALQMAEYSFELTPQVTAFRDYLLQTFEFDHSDEIDMVINYLTFLIKTGDDLKECLSYIDEEFDLSGTEEMREVIPLVIDIFNTTRLFEYKGHNRIEMGTSVSLGKLDGKTKKEKAKTIPFKSITIDPNGPCPCGSGKKYRFCCINKE